MTDKERIEFCLLCQEWNHNHSLKNFVKMYKRTFTRYRIGQGPLWRVYRIIKHTFNGDYKGFEKDLHTKYQEDFFRYLKDELD